MPEPQIPKGPVPIIGKNQPIRITVSQLCIKCQDEKAVTPGIFIYKGDSLCPEHYGKIKEKEKEDETSNLHQGT